MGLPEIPAEAVDATVREMGEATYTANSDDAERARDLLGAAWPYLYAAALRHAAETFITKGERYRQHPGSVVVVLLHRMADEAVQP